MDPDAVLIPDRLRSHLSNIRGAAFVKNCGKYNLMFGAIEAISKDAISKLLLFGGVDIFRIFTFGEDRWMQNCLRSIGVTPVEDFQMVGDNICDGPNNCSDGKAAYHRFKIPAAWMQCYNQAS